MPEVAKRLVRVVEAIDGEAALALYDEISPDLVILEVQMPRLDGIDVCRTLLGAARLPA